MPAGLLASLPGGLAAAGGFDAFTQAGGGGGLGALFAARVGTRGVYVLPCYFVD